MNEIILFLEQMLNVLLLSIGGVILAVVLVAVICIALIVLASTIKTIIQSGKKKGNGKNE